MPPGHIVSHLENILGQETIEFETPALRLLAQGAHGSMRDALSLTDQAIAYAAGKVTLEAVQGMLGALDQSFLVRILDALVQKDGASLLAVADDMATRSLSYNAALQDLGSLLHRIALAQTVPSAVPEDLPERDDVLRLAGLFDAEEIQLFYQIAVHGRNELGLAPDEYAGFSMTLLRMLAFRPGFGPSEAKPAAPSAPAASRPSMPAAQASAPAARLNAAPQAAMTSAPVSAPAARPNGGISPARAALEAARSGMKTPAPAARPPMPAAAAPLGVAQTPARFEQAPPMDLPDLPPAPPWDDNASSITSSMQSANDFSQPSAQKKTEQQSARSLAAAETTSVAPPVSSAAPVPARPFVPQPVDSLQWDGNWPSLAAGLPVRGVAQQLALQSELLKCEVDGNTVQFELQVPVDTLMAAGSVEKLNAALTEHFGKPVRVSAKVGAVRHTASAQAQADRAERQREAEQSMQDDPFVQKMMREFGATIVPGSVRPV
jgi:DNA polymerase-3 subunit gamma/tau